MEEIQIVNEEKEVTEAEETSLEEALAASEKARSEAEERAQALEARLYCMEMGVSSENAEDVIVLAKHLGGKTDCAIAAVLEKYPFFRSEALSEGKRPLTTGVHIEQSSPIPCSGVEEAFRRANPGIKF